MKRLLSILLVATMMFTFMVPAAFAAGGPTASVTSASAKVGETVTAQ